MSVQVALQLPDQPASGAAVLQPLGGNGFTAPHSVTRVRVLSVSDASGGSNNIFVRFDPRYSCLLASLTLHTDSGAVAIATNVSLTDQFEARTQIRKSVDLIPVSGLSSTNVLTWTPEPIIMVADANVLATQPPVIRATIGNNDTETLTMFVSIYNFDRRARELVPLNILYAVLPRGVSSV